METGLLSHFQEEVERNLQGAMQVCRNVVLDPTLLPLLSLSLGAEVERNLQDAGFSLFSPVFDLSLSGLQEVERNLQGAMQEGREEPFRTLVLALFSPVFDLSLSGLQEVERNLQDAGGERNLQEVERNLQDAMQVCRNVVLEPALLSLS
ncbi:hypothetical protein WMY93_031349 [Mugilogobius chulae]|uniref:Uncharacterized protein n=1 Tax=Mugilogobius chulae TaxID=88201 RepID=A0AAW0MDR8_9GOBI